MKRLLLFVLATTLGVVAANGPVKVVYPKGFKINDFFHDVKEVIDWPKLAAEKKIPSVDPKKPLRFEVLCKPLFEETETDVLRAIMRMIPMHLNFEEFTKDENCRLVSVPKCASWSERQILDLTFPWQDAQGKEVGSPAERFKTVFDIGCAQTWVEWQILDDSHYALLKDIPIREVVNWPNIKPSLLSAILLHQNVYLGLSAPSKLADWGLTQVLQHDDFRNGKMKLWQVFDAGCLTSFVKTNGRFAKDYAAVLTKVLPALDDDEVGKMMWLLRSESFLTKLFSSWSVVSSQDRFDILDDLHAARQSLGDAFKGVSRNLRSLLEEFCKAEPKKLDKYPFFASELKLFFAHVHALFKGEDLETQSSYLGDFLMAFPMELSVVDGAKAEVLKNITAKSLKELERHLGTLTASETSSNVPTDAFRLASILLTVGFEGAKDMIAEMRRILASKPAIRGTIVRKLATVQDFVPAIFAMIDNKEDLVSAGLFMSSNATPGLVMQVARTSMSRYGHAYTFVEATMYNMGLRPNDQGEFIANSRLNILAHNKCMLTVADNHLQDGGGPQKSFIGDMVNMFLDRRIFVPVDKSPQFKFNWLNDPEVGLLAGLFFGKCMQIKATLPVPFHAPFFHLIADPTPEKIDAYFNAYYRDEEMAKFDKNFFISITERDISVKNVDNLLLLLEAWKFTRLDTIRYHMVDADTNFVTSPLTGSEDTQYEPHFVMEAFEEQYLRPRREGNAMAVDQPRFFFEEFHAVLNPHPLTLASLEGEGLNEGEIKVRVARHIVSLARKYIVEALRLARPNFHRFVANFMESFRHTFLVDGLKYLPNPGLFNALLDLNDLNPKDFFEKIKISGLHKTLVPSLIVEKREEFVFTEDGFVNAITDLGLPISESFGEDHVKVPVRKGQKGVRITPYKLTTEQLLESLIMSCNTLQLRRITYVITGNSHMRLAEMDPMKISLEPAPVELPNARDATPYGFEDISKVQTMHGDQTLTFESWKTLLLKMAEIQAEMLKLPRVRPFTSVDELYNVFGEKIIAKAPEFELPGVFAFFKIQTCATSVSFKADNRFVYTITAPFLNCHTTQFDEGRH